MATTFYLRSEAVDVVGTGTIVLAALTRGSGLTVGTTDTVAGPTAALQCRVSSGGNFITWYTNPLNAVTISGSITTNLWMGESTIAANATAGISVVRADRAGAWISYLLNASIRGTEMGTSRAAQNWSATPTSTVFADGDRLSIIAQIDDATAVNMGSARTVTLGYSGPTGAADGDSWVQFTETITEQASPIYQPFRQSSTIYKL